MLMMYVSKYIAKGEPNIEISTSKSDCTENCNRSNCGFLFDDRLNNSDANMVCVPVDEDMEGEPPSKTQQISGGGAENVQLRRRVRERKRASNGEALNAKNPRAAVAADEDKENSASAASIPVFGESGSSNSAFREGHWPLEIHYIILPFLLENATSLLEKTREVTSPGPWPLISVYLGVVLILGVSTCTQIIQKGFFLLRISDPLPQLYRAQAL